MREREVDVFLCHNLANICYLTGFQTLGSYGYGHYAALVPAHGKPTLFASDFESHNARIYSWLDDIVTYGVMPSHQGGPVEELARLLQKLGFARARIGYETSHFAMTLEEAERLRSNLPRARFEDVTGLADPIKIIKSPAEIAVMRQTAGLTSASLLAGIAAAKEGGADNVIAAAMYAAAVAGGAEYFSLQPIVTTGRRSGIPHSTFRRTPLRCGDVVFLEAAASYQRYSAPAMRAVFIGRPSAEVRRAHDACRASVETLLENIRGGASGATIAARADQRLRAIEPALVWHGYFGYSVGLTFPPMCTDCQINSSITTKRDLILQPGMVFHCNTSLRKLGWFGVAVGETVLVTQNGCETLTNVPRELKTVE